MIFRSRSNGDRFFVKPADVGYEQRYRITRANGEIEIHVVHISAGTPEGDYLVTTLNKGDLIEPIWNV